MERWVGVLSYLAEAGAARCSAAVRRSKAAGGDDARQQRRHERRHCGFGMLQSSCTQPLDSRRRGGDGGRVATLRVCVEVSKMYPHLGWRYRSYDDGLASSAARQSEGGARLFLLLTAVNHRTPITDDAFERRRETQRDPDSWHR